MKRLPPSRHYLSERSLVPLGLRAYGGIPQPGRHRIKTWHKSATRKQLWIILKPSSCVRPKDTCSAN